LLRQSPQKTFFESAKLALDEQLDRIAPTVEQTTVSA
jgi:hypothetical protein